MNGTNPKRITTAAGMTTAEGAGSGSPPASGLSAEDEAIAARWRTEVGEERFRRMVRALAGGRPGRKPEEPKRRHLLLMMARLSRANPKAVPNRLASWVASSPEGCAEIPTKDALIRWLRREWSKQGPALKREIAVAERRRSGRELTDILAAVALMKQEALTASQNSAVHAFVAAQEAALDPSLQANLAAVALMKQEALTASQNSAVHAFVAAQEAGAHERVPIPLTLPLDKMPSD